MAHLIPTAEPGVLIARSKSNPGTYYVITGAGTGTVHCNCPGFIYRGICVHAKEALDRRTKYELILKAVERKLVSGR